MIATSIGRCRPPSTTPGGHRRGKPSRAVEIEQLAGVQRAAINQAKKHWLRPA
jgi:hypothetical protein